MRITSWREQLDNKAIIDAYNNANDNDNYKLADNIAGANPHIDWIRVDNDRFVAKEQAHLNRLQDDIANAE